MASFENVRLVTSLDEVRTEDGSARSPVVVVDLTAGEEIALAQELYGRGAGAVVAIVDDSVPNLAGWADAGVVGFVTGDDALDDLADAVAAAARGETTCTKAAARLLLQQLRWDSAVEMLSTDRFSRLNRRERDVLALIGRGLTNAEIAAELFLSVATVKNYVHRILVKLEVDSRHAAVDLVRESARTGFGLHAERVGRRGVGS